jgi:hypothetical protein
MIGMKIAMNAAIDADSPKYPDCDMEPENG